MSNEQFFFFPQCSLRIWRTFYHFHQTWNCRLHTLSIWKCLKLIVWVKQAKQFRLNNLTIQPFTYNIKTSDDYKFNMGKMTELYFNPLPDDKILDWSKIKQSADDILTLSPNEPWFLRVYGTSLLKTLWEKTKLLLMSNFFFSHSVFYPFIEISAILIKFEIVVCKLFLFGPV